MTSDAHKNQKEPVGPSPEDVSVPRLRVLPEVVAKGTAVPTGIAASKDTPAPAGKAGLGAESKPAPAPKGAAVPAPKAADAALKRAYAPKQPTEVAAKTVTASKRNWKSKALVVAVAGVVLLGAGTFFGTTLPDPSKSDQYLALQESKTGADQKVQSLEKNYITLEEIYLKLKGDVEAREAAVLSRDEAAAEKEKEVAVSEAAVKKREEAVTGAESQKAKNTFGDSTRTVGRDIEPGIYVTAADVGSSCYWAILASGTNGSDIVDNDLPRGGRPSVTIIEGQDFKSSRCGSWTKQ